jgi:hypothetical protein
VQKEIMKTIEIVLFGYLLGLLSNSVDAQAIRSVLGGHVGYSDTEELRDDEFSKKLRSRRRNAVKNIDYFTFEIRMQPDSTSEGVCTVDDLASISQDIDQAIQSIEFSLNSPSTGISLIAGVCSTPESESPLKRERARHLQGSPGWLWNGGGGRCNKCPPDNGDNIIAPPDSVAALPMTTSLKSLKGNIFLKGAALKKEIKSLLLFAVTNGVIPLHQDCLGDSPKVVVNVDMVNADTFNLGCPQDSSLSMGIEAISSTLP